MKQAIKLLGVKEVNEHCGYDGSRVVSHEFPFAPWVVSPGFPFAQGHTSLDVIQRHINSLHAEG